jgi:uncharacterized protein with HEPN domain
MKPGPDGDALHLDRIVEAIELIRHSLVGVVRAAFLEDRTKGDATAPRLAPIGEAGRKLSEELRAGHPDIAWRQIYALRNIVAHRYFDLKYDILWKVVAEHLDALEVACRAELKRIDG